METGIASEEKGGVRPLTDHELATRLSYFLWNTIPDPELSRAADGGKLRDPGVLAAQARRMLRHPRAEEFIKEFSRQWLRIQEISGHAPDASVLGYPPSGTRLRSGASTSRIASMLAWARAFVCF